ncbi:MAG: hypothetical protein ACFE91_05740 [Promethearchaeota archaeon]
MLKIRPYIIIGFLCTFFCVLTVSMIMIHSDQSTNDEIISGTGEIVFLSFEGGFYGIISNDGKHYDPINLPDEFKIDGLRISFTAKIRPDLVSLHMWGTIVELLSIKRLKFLPSCNP